MPLSQLANISVPKLSFSISSANTVSRFCRLQMRINHKCWFCCKIQMSIAIENFYYCIIAHLLTISYAMFLLRCRNRIIEHQNPSWLANTRQRPTNPSSFALSHEQREHKGLQPYRMPQTMTSLTFASSTESLTSLKESFLQLEIAKAIQSLSHWDSYWSMNRVYCDATQQRCLKKWQQMLDIQYLHFDAFLHRQYYSVRSSI